MLSFGFPDLCDYVSLLRKQRLLQAAENGKLSANIFMFLFFATVLSYYKYDGGRGFGSTPSFSR